MECSVIGCIKPSFRTGLCGAHYSAKRKADSAPCSHDGCSAPSTKRGMCEPHYRAALAAASQPCAVAGCARPVVSKGLCDAHRKRKDRHSHLDPTRPKDWGGRRSHPLYNTWYWHMRHKHRGNFCERWHDFWVFVADVVGRPTDAHRLVRPDETSPYGPENFEWRQVVLPFFDEEAGKARASKYQSQYRKRHPERVRSYKFKAAYGITTEEYRAMESAQGGKCAICGSSETAVNKVTQEPRSLAVDHCHGRGHVRALLCAACNGGLGSFRDNPELLRAAAAYIERHTLQDSPT